MATPAEKQVQKTARVPFDLYAGIQSYTVYWLERAVEMVESGEVQKPEAVKIAMCAGEPISGEYHRVPKGSSKSSVPRT